MLTPYRSASLRISGVLTYRRLLSSGRKALHKWRAQSGIFATSQSKRAWRVASIYRLGSVDNGDARSALIRAAKCIIALKHLGSAKLVAASKRADDARKTGSSESHRESMPSARAAEIRRRIEIIGVKISRMWQQSWRAPDASSVLLRRHIWEIAS